jgi:hypothetical protein
VHSDLPDPVLAPQFQIWEPIGSDHPSYLAGTPRHLMDRNVLGYAQRMTNLWMDLSDWLMDEQKLSMVMLKELLTLFGYIHLQITIPTRRSMSGDQQIQMRLHLDYGVALLVFLRRWFYDIEYRELVTYPFKASQKPIWKGKEAIEKLHDTYLLQRYDITKGMCIINFILRFIGGWKGVSKNIRAGNRQVGNRGMSSRIDAPTERDEALMAETEQEDITRRGLEKEVISVRSRVPVYPMIEEYRVVCWCNNKIQTTCASCRDSKEIVTAVLLMKIGYNKKQFEGIEMPDAPPLPSAVYGQNAIRMFYAQRNDQLEDFVHYRHQEPILPSHTVDSV